MRLAHFGTFDVANYGDLLFPLVIERRLGGDVDEILHVSPVGGAPPTADGRPSTDPAAVAHRSGPVGAVVVGGGNLIVAGRSGQAAYAGDPVLAYPDLWLGAAALAVRRRVPLVVNGPGVPLPLDPVSAALARALWSGAARVAVRDVASARRLTRAVGPAPDVVPDTALDVSELWSPGELATARRALLEAAGHPAHARTLAVHVKGSWATADLAGVAAAVDAIAGAAGAVPVLVAIGPCHGDDRAARAVGAALGEPAIVLDRLDRLVDVAAVIAGSVAYVGSSLHGMVTARAFATPGLLVAPPGPHRDPKFAGFLDQVGWSGRLVDSWGAAAGDRGWCHVGPDDHVSLLRARRRLDEHWDAVRTALVAPPPPRGPIARGVAHPSVWPTVMRGRDLLARGRRRARGGAEGAAGAARRRAPTPADR